MNEILILSTARKAVLARLSSLGRHFCADDVNEMVSMTVERFYTKGHFDPSKASVQTYVSRIACNVVYDFVRATDRDRSRVVRLDAIRDTESDSGKRVKDDPVHNLWFSDDREADTLLLVEEEEALLHQAKDRLDPKQRECYNLLAEGKTHEDIARLMDTTAGNVGVAAHRMRKQFKAYFEEVA